MRFDPISSSDNILRSCNASLLRTIVADSRFRYLTFENVSPEEFAIESLAGSNLISLRLCFSGKSKVDLSSIVDVTSGLANLADLHIRTQSVISNTACLSKMTALKSLLLETDMYRYTGPEPIHMPKTLFQLTSLTLIGFVEVGFASLSHLPALNELCLINCRHSTHSHQTFRLPDHPQLCLDRYHIEHLEFGSWNFTLSSASLPCLTRIQDLTIDMVGTFADVTGDVLRRAVGLRRLCLANMFELAQLDFLNDMPKLENLILRNLADLRNVEGLTKASVLSFLHVSGNVLIDELFLAHLSAARALRTLSVVGLNEMAAISVINAADRIARLERLIVTDEQAKTLRRCLNRREVQNTTVDMFVMKSIDATRMSELERSTFSRDHPSIVDR
ncbi:hypothetical protein CYMTET_54258 [Cymbomonas tetramitiformis]|uniref:Uncharacterized protein n=2 Tax=Cymbomonas tetramitiformis TaxID=36881 RepID=A0AAE0EP91_9CHLO|nr:hypothetical protein CYMTET_54258 [Cymbomonas tetramitiformis]